MTQLALCLANWLGAAQLSIQANILRTWLHCECDSNYVKKDTKRKYYVRKPSSACHFLSCHSTNNSDCAQTFEVHKTTLPVWLSFLAYAHLLSSGFLLCPFKIKIQAELSSRVAVWSGFKVYLLLPNVMISSALSIYRSFEVLISIQTFLKSNRFLSYQSLIVNHLPFAVLVSAKRQSLLKLGTGIDFIHWKLVPLLVADIKFLLTWL